MKSSKHRQSRNKIFADLVNVMARLRAPGGCPWDRKQTHVSLLKYLKEESDEVIQAVRKNDMANLKEELGDVLLQVLFHAEIANESDHFDIWGVADHLRRKLIRRHPHVFKRKRGESEMTAEEVVRRWKMMKRREK